MGATSSAPGKVGMALRWTLVSLALACLALALLTYVDYATGANELKGDNDSSRGAVYGFVMFALMLGIPGGISLVRARAAQRHRRELDLLLGYVRSRDTIALSELARALGQNEIQAEATLLELIQHKEVDLVFHQDRNEYLHRARLRGAFRSVESCDSCGARVRARVIFDGETANCEFCDAPLRAHAPHPPAPHSHAQMPPYSG